MNIYHYEDLSRPWPYELPRGYREAMLGKSIEEQLEYLRFTYSYQIAQKTSFDKPVHEDYAKLKNEVKASDFMKISVPFTLTAVLSGYAIIWLFWGIM